MLTLQFTVKKIMLLADTLSLILVWKCPWGTSFIGGYIGCYFTWRTNFCLGVTTKKGNTQWQNKYSYQLSSFHSCSCQEPDVRISDCNYVYNEKLLTIFPQYIKIYTSANEHCNNLWQLKLKCQSSNIAIWKSRFQTITQTVYLEKKW